MTNATLFFAAVGVVGLAAQWLAWRFRIPAIILLLVAGLIFGPATGLLVPAHILGSLIQPMVAAAVAISTVVQPLLRNAKMESRPASVLRWEAIVNDPIGALFAVLAFEVFVQSHTGKPPLEIGISLAAYVAIAGGLGYGLARAISYAYRTTLVPEYLKVPMLFVLVLACLVGGNLLLDEAGLLAVTVMGVTLGNSRIASLAEIRRFKEHAAVLLVSGVFVVLTANIDPRMLMTLNWQMALFVVLLIFVLRPVGVFLTTIATNLTWRERLLIGWVAPRGVVAVATAAVFGSVLVGNGAPDGAKIPPLVFAIVLVTVVLYGLSTVPLARWLKLASDAQPGVLVVGANRWTFSLAELFKEVGVPVTIADQSWLRLKPARDAGIPIYYGEILAEAASHRLDHARFGELIAATDSNPYNTLVCTDLAPIFGRQHAYQIGRMESQEIDPNDIALALGGRTLMKAGFDHDGLNRRLSEGWVFRKTTLTDEFDFDAYRATLSQDAQLLFAQKADGRLSFATTNSGPRPGAGDTVVAFSPPADPAPPNGHPKMND